MATPASNKGFLWKLLNLLVSSLAANDKVGHDEAISGNFS